MTNLESRVFADPHALAEAAADEFVLAAREALAARDVFRVALAGGRTPRETYVRLASEPRRSRVDWGRVHAFFGDERCLPAGHPDRNDKQARLALLDHVPIAEEHVHPIDAESPDAAELAESELRIAFHLGRGALPAFDLVLLGLGADGHTASLFPGSPALEEKRRLAVRVEGAPKPYTERITLTLPVLSAASRVLFLATGAGKREAAAKLQAGDASIPAALVAARKRLVFLDESAAA